MSALLEQVAKELGAFAVAELTQLPPALPPPKPAAPAAAKPATPAAVAKPAAVAGTPTPLTGASQSPAVVPPSGTQGGAAPVAPATAPVASTSPAPSAPRPAPATAAPAVVPKPVQFWNFAEKGFHLEVTITPDKVVEAAKVMDKHGFAIDAVTGMDWLAQGLMEVIYDFLHFQSGERVVFRARIPRNDPKIDTICKIFGGANWHERETKDMYGIIFVGHPDLTPFLLPDDADYHPLRKDFNP